MSYVGEDTASRIGIGPGFILGWIATTVGTAIRLGAYRELGRFFTFSLAIRKDHKLVTSGPYSYVRHPSYTALILTCPGIIGCLLCEGSWTRESGVLDTPWGYYIESLINWLCLLFPLALAHRTYKEDEILKAEFQGQWEEWAKNVPYKLFPGVF
jgi:protein-S-isoprenylcysteine O-methyltransferase Ste14